MKYEFSTIGIIHTPFKERFCIPRQPGLVPSAEGIIVFKNDHRMKTALKGIHEFTHLWILFVFHQHNAKDWKPSIRPPRLGGAEKKGVLASRSPHRPNPIGMSVCPITKIDLEAKGGPRIHVTGVDLLDGTPVLDIKPYIPYADSVLDAKSGWAADPIQRYDVAYSDLALEKIEKESRKYPYLKNLLEELISLDPRPSSQKSKAPVGSKEAHETNHGVLVLDYDIKWQIKDHTIWIMDLAEPPAGKKTK